MTDRPLLTVAEVAARLRVARMTVYREIDRGRLPASRVGRNWRIDPDDLDAYLNTNGTPTDEDTR